MSEPRELWVRVRDVDGSDEYYGGDTPYFGWTSLQAAIDETIRESKRGEDGRYPVRADQFVQYVPAANETRAAVEALRRVREQADARMWSLRRKAEWPKDPDTHQGSMRLREMARGIEEVLTLINDEIAKLEGK